MLGDGYYCACPSLYTRRIRLKSKSSSMSRFRWELTPFETHLNYVANGTTKFDGRVAPEQDQFHASTEWTAGVTDEIRAGFVLLSAVVPGLGAQYAGFRVLPHFYTPKSWGLPVNLGFVAEFSFERPLFDQDTRQVELRGIIEKHVGRLQMDGNVVFQRALHGPGARDG